MVEDLVFRKYLRTLNRFYKGMDRRFLGRRIQASYDEIAPRVQFVNNDIPGKVAITYAAGAAEFIAATLQSR